MTRLTRAASRLDDRTRAAIRTIAPMLWALLVARLLDNGIDIYAHLGDWLGVSMPTAAAIGTAAVFAVLDNVARYVPSVWLEALIKVLPGAPSYTPSGFAPVGAVGDSPARPAVTRMVDGYWAKPAPDAEMDDANPDGGEEPPLTDTQRQAIAAHRERLASEREALRGRSK